MGGGTPMFSVLAPIAASERVLALDVLRAIALFAVFLINVEYFSRPLEAHGLGLEPGLAGISYALAWSEYVFVEGKAWCLFALLFGMGFAVMQERAQNTQRGFVAPYLRRIAMLLLLGVTHVALLWAGDVLHSYAFAAAVMLVMLYGRAWWLLLPVPAFAAALLLVGGRGYLGGVIAFTLFAATAAWIRRGGVDRLWKAGAMLYMSPVVVITAMTLPALMAPPSVETVAARAGRIAQLQSEVVHATEVIRSGSYLDNLVLRVSDVLGDLPDETRLLVAAVGLFLVGSWFVRAGVVRDLSRHRALLGRIAIAGLLVGLGLALASASIAIGLDAKRATLWTLASQLMALAALPASVGAACAVLWVLSAGVRLGWLAPAGRMALSNYLMQSVVGTMVFYGYGAGLAGQIDRVGQLLLVVVVFALQLALSHWWLRHFRFGPVEWLWRAVTYLSWPPLRRAMDAVHVVQAREDLGRCRDLQSQANGPTCRGW
ncbi:MAG TPA: DUF418 domain-containing protein [Lysobacter sp.]